MAGIGFSLRKLRRGGGFTGHGMLYGAAGLISSGPWLISILAILLTGLTGRALVPDRAEIPQFQVSVTYLFAGSLVASGPLQLLFTRFAADRIYEDAPRRVLPNLLGAMTLTTAVAGAAATLIMLLFFADQSLVYKALMVESFVLLCNLWLVIVLLSGLKRYGAVLSSFAAAYGLTLAASVALSPAGLEGLLAAFTAGQALLLFLCLRLVVRHYPGAGLLAFDFLRRDEIVPCLALTGLLFNLGIWIDKALFWMNPLTSEAVLGPLRGSYLYDVPVLLAYLSVVPGMAVFLVRLETDFAGRHASFYDAVRRGAPLARIEALRDDMTVAARRGIHDIAKVQALTLLLVVIFGRDILRLFGMSELFYPLLCIDAAAAGVQVMLLAVLNVFFYLDRRRIALWLCALFAGMNFAGTLATQALGYAFYGYGFAAAVLCATLTGLALLDRCFGNLVRDTFMLQGGGS